jgi:STE24 endopeptidase
MNEPRASRYHRVKRRAAVAAMLASAAFFALLVTSGTSASVRDAAAAAASLFPPAFAPFLTVAIYVAIVVVAHEIVALPFGFFEGFVLERQYGLSRLRARGWVRDHAKALGVGLVLGMAAASAIYAALRAWPAWWWAASAAIFTGATVVLAQLAPVVLLPMFYRFTPVQNESLRQRLVALASRAGARVLGVFEWRLGEKTSRANAALVGLNRTRRILLSDTLLEHYSDDEIEVILAHELAHHVHGDIWKGVAVEAGLTLVSFLAAHAALTWFGPPAGLGSPADVAGLPILVLAGGGISVAAVPLLNALSRTHERRADRYALEATGNREAFMSAMRRLAAQNLAEERPSRLVQVLFYTHPPIAERLEAARRWTPIAGQ